MRGKFAILINTAAGVKKVDKISQIKDATRGLNMEVFPVKSRDLEKLTLELVRNNYKYLIAAGGDGTVNTVASHLVGTKKTLGVIPMGTMNNFAKTLGIPLDVNEAVEIISRRKVKKIDIGQVNGIFFLNNACIGYYPRLVEIRKNFQLLGIHKFSAYLRAFMELAFKKPNDLTVNLRSRDKDMILSTPLIFIGNNKYELESFIDFGTRKRLDDGLLSIIYLKNKMILDRFEAKSLLIQSSSPSMKIAVDGEVKKADSPLNFRILPKSLKVISP